MTNVDEQYIDITGLDMIEVFRRLYNAAKPQGLGFLHFTPQDMTDDEAVIEFNTSPDYVKGRVMKVTFYTRADMTRRVASYNGDLSQVPSYDVFFSPSLYDRDNGQGTAARVVSKYRGEQDGPQ